MSPLVSSTQASTWRAAAPGGPERRRALLTPNPAAVINTVTAGAMQIGGAALAGVNDIGDGIVAAQNEIATALADPPAANVQQSANVLKAPPPRRSRLGPPSTRAATRPGWSSSAHRSWVHRCARAVLKPRTEAVRGMKSGKK
jgi:hypothetical protein